jgi:hypothetical protein
MKLPDYLREFLKWAVAHHQRHFDHRHEEDFGDLFSYRYGIIDKYTDAHLIDEFLYFEPEFLEDSEYVIDILVERLKDYGDPSIVFDESKIWDSIREFEVREMPWEPQTPEGQKAERKHLKKLLKVEEPVEEEELRKKFKDLAK